MRRAPATAIEAAQAVAMRAAGASYQEIADRLGYAYCAAAWKLVLRAVGDDQELRRAICGRRARGHGTAFPHIDGYYRVIAHGHPLAGRDGRALHHRVVLYDHLGPGPHPCAKCGRVLEWGALDVDHINCDKADNRPANLQPCCRSCNAKLMWHRRWRPGIDYPAWMDDPECPDDFEGWERAA
jgi:hypothetical protein